MAKRDKPLGRDKERAKRSWCKERSREPHRDNCSMHACCLLLDHSGNHVCGTCGARWS